MAPFQYSPYRSPYVGTMAELMMEPGRAQAQAAQQSGQAWGQAANQIGQIAGSIPQQIQQQQYLQQQTALHGLQLSEAQKAAQFRDALSVTLKNTPQQTEDGVSVYDLPAIAKSLADQGHGAYTGDVVKTLSSLNDAFRAEAAAKVAVVQRGAQAIVRAGNDPGLALHFLDQLEANKSYPKEQIDQFRAFIQQDPANVAKLTAALAGPQKIGAARPGSTLYNESNGATVATVPSLPERPTVVPQGGIAINPAGETIATGQPKEAPQKSLQTKSVLLDGKPAEVIFDPGSGQFKDASGADVSARVKPIPPAAVQAANAPAAAEARTNNAQQLVDGNMPPSMLSRRGADYNPTLAEANKINIERTGKPINLGKLQLDYEAAKKFVSGMNSSQMIRYRGLSESVVNTINEVQRLADSLQQGGVQKWNQVKRSTIRQVYGNTPDSELANQYVGAVNTLKEEFANLANGGYAPTDAAWKLANDQINQDFGFKDLRASLTEVQRLINFRTSAFNDQQPYQMGGSDKTATTPKPTGRFNPATGKVESIP